MNFYGKKTIFLLLLLSFGSIIPYVAFAQTEEMTQSLDNQTADEQYTILNTEFEPLDSPIVISPDKKKPNFQQKEVPTKPLEQEPKQVEKKEDKTPVTIFNIPNIDTQKVQKAWADMINNVRAAESGYYKIDPTLAATSTERANYLGENRIFKQMHKRPGQKCKNNRCYDLDDWMTIRGVSPSVGESIGYGGYSCNKEDCTDNLIEATKKTFKFFMSEAKKNGPHYKMLVSGQYSKVGIGISQTKASRGNAYILVMHVSN